MRISLIVAALLMLAGPAFAQQAEMSKATGFAVLQGADQRASVVKGFAVLNAQDQRLGKLTGFAVLNALDQRLSKLTGFVVLQKE